MKKLFYLLSCAAMILPTAAHSQSIGDLLVSSIKSKGMKKICLQQDFLSHFTAVTFGYYPNSFQNNQTEDDLAFEMAAASSAQWTFAGWSGYSTEGSCHMNISITLPTQYVDQFGGNAQIQGEAYVNIVNQGGTWKIRSITDSPGSGDNQFKKFARPYVTAILQNRKEQARVAERQEEGRRQAAAEASRQEWIRTHPKEYAAEQAAARQSDAQYRALVAAKQEDDARRAKACESNGGTWGQRTNSYGVAVGAVGCFFQTVGN